MNSSALRMHSSTEINEVHSNFSELVFKRRETTTQLQRILGRVVQLCQVFQYVRGSHKSGTYIVFNAGKNNLDFSKTLREPNKTQYYLDTQLDTPKGYQFAALCSDSEDTVLQKCWEFFNIVFTVWFPMNSQLNNLTFKLFLFTTK